LTCAYLYGYNERDRWVEKYVFPVVTAFGCEVVHGKAVYGGALPDEVKKAIRTADAMIGFTTRRDPAGPDTFRTHAWVVQELGVADAQDPPIPWVEVREEGVVSPGGILEAVNAQRIDYREADLAACLVQIAEALRRFRDQTNVTMIRLGPIAAVEQINPFLDDATLVCMCQILRGAVQFPARRIPVLPIKGGLFVQLHGVAQGELVRITISAGGRIWRSSYESVDTVDIQVKE
jgi:hypothetical protein